MTQPNRILLIGRHAPDLGADGGEIAEQRNITFPATAGACAPLLNNLFDDARALAAALVFQALPAQVTAALFQIARRDTRVGVIVSKPGERPAAESSAWDFSSVADAFLAYGAVNAANPNAKIAQAGTQIIITADPPMRFVFSHVEWLW
jgi:hypothetical protein